MTQVTIGMPLYNNSATLAAALDSLLSQSMGEFRIFASDDCSTDNTASICAAYARRDSRIAYVRQTRNLGYGNFRFVLDQADTPFFMWAAGDDRWAPTFIEKNLNAIKADPLVVGSVSRVRFEKEGQPLYVAMGTYPLPGTIHENIARFLSHPNDNSRMYGVFRTEVLQQSFPSGCFHAYDWAVSAATLLHGKHNEVPEVLMFRDWTPPPRYNDLVRKDHSFVLQRLFPLARMTAWLMFRAKIPLTPSITGALLALNIDRHLMYCDKFHPRYSKCIKPLQKLWQHYLRWRLLSA